MPTNEQNGDIVTTREYQAPIGLVRCTTISPTETSSMRSKLEGRRSVYDLVERATEQNARDVQDWVHASNKWYKTATDEEKKRGFPSFAQWLAAENKRAEVLARCERIENRMDL